MDRFINNELEELNFFGKFIESNEFLTLNFTINNDIFLFLRNCIYTFALDEFLQLYEKLDRKNFSFDENTIADYYYCRYLFLKGRYEECLNCHVQIINRLKVEKNKNNLEVNLLYEIHMLKISAFFKTGKLKPALQSLNEIQSTLKGISENNKIQIAVMKGNVHYELGNANQSLKFLQKAFDFYTTINNEYKIAGVLNNIARILSIQGKLHESEDYFEKACNLHRKFNNLADFVLSAGNLATVLYNQGKIDESIKFGFEMLAITSKTKEPFGFGYTNFILGLNYFAIANNGVAENYFKTALENWLKIKNPFLISSCIFYLVNLNVRLERNIDSIKQILTYYPTNPFPTKVVALIYEIIQAELYIDQKEYSKAKDLLQNALKKKGLEFGFQIQDHENLIYIYYEEYLQINDINLLKNVFNQLDQWESFCIENNLNPSLCKVLILRAQVYVTLLQIEEANKQLKKCVSLAEANNLPYHKKLAQDEINRFSYLTSKMNSLKDDEKMIEQSGIVNFLSYLREIEKIFRKQLN